MDLDLGRLREMHPRLPVDVALLLVTRAALGLGRNGHASGVGISLDIQRVLSRGLLAWPGADLGEIDHHDSKRITEDGAEAVALVLAHLHGGWRVRRRLQQRENADWLLEGPGNGRRRVAALEVSGVDRGSIASRLRDKLQQVARCRDVDQRWAGVVGFEKPRAALHATKASTRGR